MRVAFIGNHSERTFKSLSMMKVANQFGILLEEAFITRGFRSRRLRTYAADLNIENGSIEIHRP